MDIEEFIEARNTIIAKLNTRLLFPNDLKQLLALNNIDFEGKCIYCGNKLGGRRKTFCSDDCKYDYYEHFSQAGIRQRLVRERGAYCEDCKEKFEELRQNQDGNPYTYVYEELELHHRTPLFDGGHPFDDSNLILLCRTCHGKAHQKYNFDIREEKRLADLKRMKEYWARF